MLSRNNYSTEISVADLEYMKFQNRAIIKSVMDFNFKMLRGKKVFSLPAKT